MQLGPSGNLTLRKAAQQGFSAPFTLTAQREERLFALMVWVQALFTFGGQVRVAGCGKGGTRDREVSACLRS